MKWFWRINYYLTIFFFIALIISISIIHIDEYYANHNWIKIVDKIITLDGTSVFLSMIIEWIQIPLCIVVTIFWKDQRTKWHFIYIIFLLFLNIFKWITMLFIAAHVTYKTI